MALSVYDSRPRHTRPMAMGTRGHHGLVFRIVHRAHLLGARGPRELRWVLPITSLAIRPRDLQSASTLLVKAHLRLRHLPGLRFRQPRWTIFLHVECRPLARVSPKALEHLQLSEGLDGGKSEVEVTIGHGRFRPVGLRSHQNGGCSSGLADLQRISAPRRDQLP
jgi:hypothetical protein